MREHHGGDLSHWDVDPEAHSDSERHEAHKARRKKMDLHLQKGALHKDLGVASGEKIPVAKIRKAAQSSSAKLRKRAQFALNARKWHHG